MICQKEEGLSPKFFENVVWQKIQKQPNGELSLSRSTTHISLHISFLIRGVVRVDLELLGWHGRLLKLQVDLPDVMETGIGSGK